MREGSTELRPSFKGSAIPFTCTQDMHRFQPATNKSVYTMLLIIIRTEIRNIRTSFINNFKGSNTNYILICFFIGKNINYL